MFVIVVHTLNCSDSARKNLKTIRVCGSKPLAEPVLKEGKYKQRIILGAIRGACMS